MLIDTKLYEQTLDVVEYIHDAHTDKIRNDSIDESGYRFFPFTPTSFAYVFHSNKAGIPRVT